MNNGLTLAFIERKPVAAARALNALPVADAAAFLQTIPTRYATRVVARTSAWPASKILLSMWVSSAAAVLRALPYLDSVAILRLIRPAERAALLEELPRKLRHDLETTMAYPTDTVGGQMSVDIVTLNPTHNVADAHDALSKTSAENVDTLFLVDRGRRYLGSIAVHELFRHDRETALADLPKQTSRPLLARQSLGSALGLDAWNQSSNLPVLGRSKHLVGSLPIRQLLAAGPQKSRRRASINTLVEAYFGTAASLIGLFTANKVQPAQGQERPS